MYNPEEILEPFWAEYSSDASGRDPLAIQNSSVVIYSRIVIGITNVTNRIRYNGFFCWIFDTIAKNVTKKNSLEEQIKHSRRAELLLAFIMVKNFKDITGVSGSQYATKHLKTKISLKKGADWEYKKEKGSELYWRNKFGIFGQYYSGVLRDLNLINHPQGDLNIYTLTQDGHKLADAFRNNISKKESELFLKCIINGEVEESELVKLKSIALHLIPDGSLEQSFYKNILISHDDKKSIPTYNRKNSIKLILNHLANNNEDIENVTSSFLKNNYLQNAFSSELKSDTSTSWYLYEMNELLHVAYEHFHTCFLNTITTYPTLVNQSLNELIDKTMISFRDEKINARIYRIEELTKQLSNQSFETYKYYNAILSSFAKKDYGATIKNSIFTMISIYLENKHHLPYLRKFSATPERNFNRAGNALEIFDDLLEQKMGLTISKYVSSIISTAINLHMYSSYGKTRIGQSMVHNYMIEGPMVWRLRGTTPTRTTPRIQNVIQYLIDLDWVKKIDKKYSITIVGKEILNSL